MGNDQVINTTIAEGIDGESVIYRERLIPGIASWLLLLFMTASLGVAYGYVYGLNLGIALTIISTLGLYLLMYLSSPVLVIDELVLRVGNARLPRKFIGDVQHLNREKTNNARRLTAHRDAYLVLRASIPTSILVTVVDTSDPHPYWHFSARKPEQVLKALGSEIDA